ncbi:MAG: GGDEF domain-containing protein [Lachnospiraceae bacterium]|nr:GGDEF domain-containing protein [Lachnospiraceae bacterium]
MYYLCPLHYFDNNYGYVVFTDDAYIINDAIMYPYLEKIQQSLRLLRVNLRLKLLYDKDALTGLYNRLGYEEKVLPLYQESLEQNTKLTVFFIDINYMKNINDNYGHEQGDVAIKTVAASIADCLQKDWVAVRYGGDEFLVIAPNCAKQKAANVKRRIEKRLNERIAEANLEYELTVSIGFVTTDPEKRPHAKLKEYVKEADDLMYQIKKVVHGEK